MLKPHDIGPFAGIDNVHKSDADYFQIQKGPDKARAALIYATDVDCDDDGWMVARPATSAETVLDAGVGAWRVGDRVFYQNGTTLYERTTTDTELLTGLIDRVRICEHWGRVFVTDGTNHWEIEETTVRTWGVPVPEVTLSSASGALEPGTYLVQASFVDTRGNEGGVSDIASATLANATGITVSIDGYSDQISAVNLYVSRKNQKETSYLTTQYLGDFPYVIYSDDVTAADPPKTAQMVGPITGAAGIFSYRAFMMMWRDKVVFRSEAAEPHLFHADNIMQFGSTVTACEGMTDGAWIGTEEGLWWISGDDPDKWIPDRKIPAAVFKGSIQIPGWRVPVMRTNERIALFVTIDGIIAAMPGGQITPLTFGKYKFSTLQRASFAYAERGDLHQILIGLVS